MAVTGATVTAAEFNREPSKVKARAADGPVFITDHGVRSYVLLSIEEYERIRPARHGLATSLRQGWADLVARSTGADAAGLVDDGNDLDIDEAWVDVDESGDLPDLSGE